MDGKDNLKKYLLRFDRYADVAKWINGLSYSVKSVVIGFIKVYNRILLKEAMDYECLKVSLW